MSDARQRIHDRVLAAGNADAGRVHGAGPRAVLPLLRGWPDPDVPDHRYLGRGEPDLCVVQVLPLYLPRLCSDAGGDGRDVHDAGTTDIPTLMTHTFASEDFSILGVQIVGGMQTLLWLAFFASFAVKMPMWPVHTWLPDAHVQAPTAGSVVLAAILLKMGGYGFLRFSLPMFPVGSEVMGPLVLWLSVIAIIYTSLVALVQEDMKKLIAYSSVAHMGYVTMGIFAVNQQGIDGAIFQMISHGFISGALFLASA